MIRFNFRYFLLAVFLFLILVFIAIYVDDTIIRPYLGDTLAVVWLYFVAKSFLNIPVFQLSIGVLILSYSVEFAQYFNIIMLMGLQDIKVAKIVLGSTFDIIDMVAYTAGWLIILFVSKLNFNSLR